MSTCPTCGGSGEIRKHGLSADELLRVLTRGEPHRNVYRAAKGGWYVTYDGGETSYEAVQELIRRGAIQSVYNGEAEYHCYHVGKTLDMQRSRFGKKGLRVYTDGTTGETR
jgi:hypothetical protein